MKFREFVLKEEPMDMGAPPMGGDPMGGGMGAPPMGGDPMGGGMADPMGGGMAPPMGGEQPEPPPVPQYADVWDVLDSILNQKPLDHEEKLQAQQDQQAQEPPPDPMGGMAPPDPMGGMAPPPGGDMGMEMGNMGGSPSPHLMS